MEVEIRVLAWLGSDEGSLLGCRLAPTSPIIFNWQKDKGLASSLPPLQRTLIPSWPFHSQDLNTFKRPHFPIPLYQELSFQHKYFRVEGEWEKGHKHAVHSNLFFNILFIYFLERGEGKEKEEEKHQCVVASHAPPTRNLACNPGMCPDWELNQWPFGSQAHAQSTELHQPGHSNNLKREECIKSWSTEKNSLSLKGFVFVFVFYHEGHKPLKPEKNIIHIFQSPHFPDEKTNTWRVVGID